MIAALAWLVLVIAAMLVIARAAAYPQASHFRYDERNPARRWCKHCNQLQEEYVYGWSPSSRDGWWEAMGAIRNPDCTCHRYAEYRR